MKDNGKMQGRAIYTLKVLLLVFLLLGAIDYIFIYAFNNFYLNSPHQISFQLLTILSIFGFTVLAFHIMTGFLAFGAKLREPFKEFRLFSLGSIFLVLLILPGLILPLSQIFLLQHAHTINQQFFNIDLNQLAIGILGLVFLPIGLLLVSRPILHGVGKVHFMVFLWYYCPVHSLI